MIMGRDKHDLGWGGGKLFLDDKYLELKAPGGDFKVPRSAITTIAVDKSFSLGIGGEMAKLKVMGPGGEIANCKISERQAKKAQDWLLGKLFP
jgi:hypothetical protein